MTSPADRVAMTLAMLAAYVQKAGGALDVSDADIAALPEGRVLAIARNREGTGFELRMVPEALARSRPDVPHIEVGLSMNADGGVEGRCNCPACSIAKSVGGKVLH